MFHMHRLWGHPMRKSHLGMHMIDTHYLIVACRHATAIGGKLRVSLDRLLRRRKPVVRGDDKMFRKNDDVMDYMGLLGPITTVAAYGGGENFSKARARGLRPKFA